MFTRIFRQSVPVVTICRSYSRRTCKLHKNVQLNSKYMSNSRNYAKTSDSLLVSQQKPKEVEREASTESNTEKISKKAENPEEEHAKKSSDHSQEKPNEEDSSKSENKNNDRFRGRPSIFAKELVLHAFENAHKKEKDTYIECLRMYKSKPGIKKERVPFIYTALKYMEEFGVHKDLSVYKQLIDILPKEKMIPTNQFQSMFVHYPKEQYCITAVLEQMEHFAVIPDPELELMLLNIFGRHGMPLEKYWKMMYWMPKFKHLNPWPTPNPFPNDVMEIARLAMDKISSIDIRSVVTIFDTQDVPDSLDKTWIVSAMAPGQGELLKKHDKNTPLYVEGPFKIYVSTKAMDYFTLRADPIPNRKYPDIDADDVEKLRNPYTETTTVDVILPPTIHEEEDGTIFANCCTGTSSKDSLLSWVRCLQKDNPILANIPIIFKLRKENREKFYLEGGNRKQMPGPESKENDDDKLLQ